MTRRDFSKLEDLCATYFHQDWTLDFEDPDQVISSYLEAGWDRQELEELAEQAIQFADSYSDDAALERALFSDLGCYYLPSADKVSARRWLHDIASRLRAVAEGAGEDPKGKNEA